MNNAKRFIKAYNSIDKTLRNLLDLKPSLTFTDVVRRGASTLALVRKHEDDLLDYGRLRNAIVHKSTDIPIAEPYDAVVEHIEHIAAMLSAPPTAQSTVAKRAVVFDSGLSVSEAIGRMSALGISNVPVLKNGAVIGVLSNKLIVEALSKNLAGLQDFADGTKIGQVLGPAREHYEIVSSGITVDAVLHAFTGNRKLQMLVLTKGGTAAGEITGVVTGGDLLEINRILDNY